MQMERQKTVAVVIPVFNEQANIDELCDRLDRETAEISRYRWKFFFVDDGSVDETVKKLIARLDGGMPISIVRLSRNFGHQAAIKAGMDCVDADAVITMDGDGQHPPEFFPRLIELWEQGNKVVQTVRVPAQVGVAGSRRTLVKWAYHVINWFADRPIAPECADFRLIDRCVLDQLKALPEVAPMIRGLVAWIGFQQTTVEYEVQARMSGKSRFTFRQLLNLLVGGIFDLSRKPLCFGTLAGAILIGVSCIGWLFGAISGLMFCIFILVAIELLGLGLVGAYLGRAYVEILDRPKYIISEKVNFPE